MMDGKSIRLRPYNESDLPLIAAWRNDVVLQTQLMARPRGSSLLAVRAWLDGRAKASDRLLWIIAELNDDHAIGYIQLDNINPIDRHCDLGICIDRVAQGRGFGSEAVRVASKYANDIWRMNKISLRVLVDNRPAIAAYAKCGFVECGRLRSHFFIDGGFKDVVLMELLFSAAAA